MNFSHFLKTLKAKQNFSSTREFYIFLGGEKYLGMTLRNFQLVESGDRPPSEKFFRVIIKKIPREEYRNAVMTYFKSHLLGECEEFLVYLDQHLSSPLNREQKSIFDSDRPTMMYSEDQLSYLSHNSDAMRFHHRVLLWREMRLEKLLGNEEIVENLSKLRLIEKSSRGIKASRVLYRIPTYENSAPSAVRKSSKYVKAILSTYMSEEGAEYQHLSYSLRLVSSGTAKKILDQILLLKKWIQNLDETEDDISKLSPFLFVGFGKHLEMREL